MATVKAYRGLLRELHKSSIFQRSAVIESNLRDALLDMQGQSNAPKHVENTLVFLRANRTHKELLERYSPLHNLSEEERIKATARRVGLNVPTEYKP